MSTELKYPGLWNIQVLIKSQTQKAEVKKELCLRLCHCRCPWETGIRKSCDILLLLTVTPLCVFPATTEIPNVHWHYVAFLLKACRRRFVTRAPRGRNVCAACVCGAAAAWLFVWKEVFNSARDKIKSIEVADLMDRSGRSHLQAQSPSVH